MLATADEAFARFKATYDAARPQLVREVLVADCETPVAAFMKLRAHANGAAFLLESVEGGAVRGRYSMIGLQPDLIWRCEKGAVTLAEPFSIHSAPVPDVADPFTSLRRVIAESRIDDSDVELPMASGLFGYLGYDMVRLMERLPERKETGLGLPDAILIRPTIMVIFDAVRDELSVVASVRPQAGVTARQAYETARERIDASIRALEGELPVDQRIDLAGISAPTPSSNTTPERFSEMVDVAKEYIKAGDIFQVVLSQRFDAPFELPPFALYRSLRRVNPAPFLCYLDFEAFQIVCSSPEILVRLREGKVTIRPIAGTRRRGATAQEDEALAGELLADPKERAEHLMLLDLGRNDVGRVSTIGSVTVTDRFFIERYSQVMHIVSNVEGILAPGHDALDALISGFPAGTVSGAPKVRAMEIIDELEADARGAYAGCIGYFGAQGQMDTCIVLRTAVIKDGVMSVQAGAGIVHDSVNESEQQECVNKAKALFKAAEEAVRFAARAGRAQ